MSPARLAVVPSGPTSDVGADLARWVLAVHARAAQLRSPRVSYLVVTPLGWHDRERLRSTLVACGAELLHRRPLPRWPPIATALYVRRLDPAALSRALRFEEAWSTLVPASPAEAWALALWSHRRIEAVKHAVRGPMRHVRFTLAPGVSAVLHPFHLADTDEAHVEAGRLEAALELLCALHEPAVSAVAPRWTSRAR
ncbi:hypothetical protein [Anaeromyxobacter oryzae]|uniref:Uncharacterized protein n=1 Tax=Anaeromyxobacter oryzae TaxID=2918170 RepID=A0ABM7WTQ6_9BACT|nr:hypothetical protein [Anaeromyxobacter oryzae]BDG02848.1 hypothetical protein AMOR_18440 [Anaeromyxobacter oryzae]